MVPQQNNRRGSRACIQDSASKTVGEVSRQKEWCHSKTTGGVHGHASRAEQAPAVGEVSGEDSKQE